MTAASDGQQGIVDVLLSKLADIKAMDNVCKLYMNIIHNSHITFCCKALTCTIVTYTCRSGNFCLLNFHVK